MPWVGAESFANTPEGELAARARSEETGIPITPQSNPNAFGRVAMPGTANELAPVLEPTLAPRPMIPSLPDLSAIEARLGSLEGRLNALAGTVEGIMDEQARNEDTEPQAAPEKPPLEYSQDPADYGEVEGDVAEDPPKPKRRKKGRDLTASVDETVEAEEAT